jgi:hypothetical protein
MSPAQHFALVYRFTEYIYRMITEYIYRMITEYIYRMITEYIYRIDYRIYLDL